MQTRLCEHAGTARLDGINLSLRVGHALEACGKLRTVEVKALAGLNGTKGRTGRVANTAREVARLVQRAVLLCLLAVVGEGLVHVDLVGRGRGRRVVGGDGDGELVRDQLDGFDVAEACESCGLRA